MNQKSISCFVVVAGSLVAASALADDDSAATILDQMESATVITPTRLRQTLEDVPASVTVLTAAQLRTYGVTSIAEALRMVPGMEVTKATGNWYQINYHGGNARQGRRLNVLVDGISVYRAGLSQIYWDKLPVAIEDVERIEVTRGPDGAAYGPNSMAAVINIITRRPIGIERATVAVGAGSQQGHRIYGRTTGTLGGTSFLASASVEGDRGYDQPDWHSSLNDSHDAVSTKRLMFRTQTNVTPALEIQMLGAHVEGTDEIPFRSSFEEHPDKRISDSYFAVAGTYTASPTHEVSARGTVSRQGIRQQWSTCFPTLTYLPQLYALHSVNPAYAIAIAQGHVPSGGTAADDALALQALLAVRALGASATKPLCGLVNQDVSERRVDFELQDTYVAGPSFRVVSGLGVRRQDAASASFLGGKAGTEQLRLFANAEWQPIGWISANVGAYAERDQRVGWTTSPRVALNLHVDEYQTVRAIVSRGTRTPDLQEQYGNYTLTLQTDSAAPDGTTTPKFFAHSMATGDLRSEVELSREIGYMLNMPNSGVLIDAKLFDDRLTDLISQPVSIYVAGQNNENGARMRGVEVQATAKSKAGFSGFATYTRLLNRATSNAEASQYSRHSGSIGLTKVFDGDVRVSGAYYGASGDGANSSFGRIDLTLSKSFGGVGQRAEAMLRVSRLDSDSITFLAGQEPASSRNNGRFQVHAEVRVSF